MTLQSQRQQREWDVFILDIHSEKAVKNKMNKYTVVRQRKHVWMEGDLDKHNRELIKQHKSTWIALLIHLISVRGLWVLYKHFHLFISRCTFFLLFPAVLPKLSHYSSLKKDSKIYFGEHLKINQLSYSTERLDNSTTA